MAPTEANPAAAPATVSGTGLRAGLERALQRLGEERERINQLNVFPVPDGDTGSNMHLTLEAALAEVAALSAGAGVDQVSRAAAHGSLMGARGNSGVILSQVLRGFAGPCQGSTELGPAGLVRALEEASRVAYSAVKRPVEGTILGVSRAAAQAAAEAQGRGAGLAEVLEAAVAEAWAAVERTRDQLEALRRAKVVDAGGFGLALILTAVAEQAGGHGGWPVGLMGSGDAGVSVVAGGSKGRGIASTTAPEGGFGYCTEFRVVGGGVEPGRLRKRLGEAAEDDSALVVGEPGLVHVHIHTHEPWVLLQQASELGQIECLKVEDMTDQHRQAREPAPSPGAEAALAVVAVAPGPGFRELLAGLGAVVVDGGGGMNPSTAEIVAGVESAQADEVLLLPNHPNLVLGAEQAARVAKVPAAVVPSRNLPQGIAALLAFDPDGPLEVNRRRMERAMGEVHAIEVARAGRTTQGGKRRIAEGEVIAVLDGEVVSGGEDIAPVVLEALGRLAPDSIEVVTLYRGAGISGTDAEGLAAEIRGRLPQVEVEVHEGGQDLYLYVISAE